MLLTLRNLNDQMDLYTYLGHFQVASVFINYEYRKEMCNVSNPEVIQAV
jgi:hypothetical protein